MLGVTLHDNMQVSEQCRITACKELPGSCNDSHKYNTRKWIDCRPTSIYTPIQSVVRLYLEYCILAGRGYLSKYIDMLEKIQRRAN